MDLRQFAVWTTMPVVFESASSPPASDVQGISVSLSLRLIDAHNLQTRISPSDYPDVWNLPELRTQGLGFNVIFLDSQGTVVRQYNGMRPVEPRVPEIGTINPLQVWRSLLAGASSAKAYLKAEAAQRTILSVPFHTVAEMLHQEYSDELFALASPANTASDLDENRRKRELGADEERDLFDEIERRVKKTGTIDFSLDEWKTPPECYSKLQWEWGILRYVLIQERNETPRNNDASVENKVGQENWRFEFHEVLASLGQYPLLARHFGLIYDLVLPSDAFTSLPNGVTHVRVDPLWPTSTPPPHVTREDLRPKTRITLSSGKPELVAQTAPYKGQFLDLTAPVFQLHQIDPNLKAARSLGSRKDGQAPPPALNSVGIALVWTGLGTSVSERLKATTEQEKIFARILSLQSGDPKPDGSELEFFADDLIRGYVVDVQDVSTGEWRSLCQRVGTYEFNGSLGSATFTDEGWVSTDGRLLGEQNIVIRDALFWWSGWSLVAQRPGKVSMPDGDIGQPDTKQGMGQFLAVGFRPVKDSLPRLRFGKRYRFRLRLVDLAGNKISLSRANNGNSPTTTDVLYGRFEPVVSPTIVPRNSLDRSHGETVSRIVVRTAESSDHNTDLSERWIFPPQASPFLAETHGMFDDVWGEAAWHIIEEHEGTLPTVVGPGDSNVQYLPDPMACNAVVNGLPYGWKPKGSSRVSEVFKCTWVIDDKWYNARPWLLQVRSSQQEKPPAVWDGANRTLTVFLQPGQQSCLSISSDISCHPSEIFALPQPQSSGGTIKRTPAEISALCAAIVGGCGTGLTPCAVMEIVHAVQRPTVAPSFGGKKQAPDIKVLRKPGQNFADFSGSVSVAAPSTGSVEIDATWNDWTDRGQREFWHVSWRRAERLAKTSVSGKNATIRISPDKGTSSGNEDDVIALRHVFGDTRHRAINYSPVVVSRYADCFDPNSVNDFERRSQGPVEVSIPNSASPPPPQIRYSVPVLSRSGSAQGTTTFKQSRIGHSIRIYLERPWHESGANELVGVILPGTQGPVPTPYIDYVSSWGQDPLHLNVSNIGEMRPEMFENRLATIEGVELGVPEVVLREVNEARLEATPEEAYRVRVVPHRVLPDLENNCWYSDVLIGRATVYAPFVRLAIVRYQPNSLPGVEVSEVRLVDYMQLLPDRIATVTRSGLSRVITITGPDTLSPPASFGGINRRVIEAGFEWAPASASGDRPDEFAWKLHPVSSSGPTLVPGMFRLEYQQAISGWRARVAMPLGLPGGSGINRRIIVREYEIYPSDEGLGHRLVYADVLPVP